MDNVCHTLVGAALAQTGLKRRTGFGAATLMIGANFPDIDVIAVPLGHGTEWRRGATHGVLALVVLPFVLTAIMMAWDRHRRSRGATGRQMLVPRELLLLSAISILTHPTLDWMNSYGMRWLMPFDGRWFYGDSLFIIDPWFMLILGIGVWMSRRLEKRVSHVGPDETRAWKPARIAVGIAAAYVVAMMGMHAHAYRTAMRELQDDPMAARRTIVMPSPGRPLLWEVVADDGERYAMGTLSVPTGRLSFDGFVETHAAEPTAILAARSHAARGFLDWARLPYYRIEGRQVTIVDARYGASIRITVP